MVPAQNLSRTPSEARKRRAKKWGCNGINGDSVSILLLQYYYYYYYDTMGCKPTIMGINY
jgi:hypothetical protein